MQDVTANNISVPASINNLRMLERLLLIWKNEGETFKTIVRTLGRILVGEDEADDAPLNDEEVNTAIDSSVYLWITYFN